MELNTGTISAEDIEDEVAEIARLLSVAGSLAVLVTYGAGCSFPDFDADAPDPLGPYTDIPVATPLLPEFIDQAEENGLYRMGRSNLFVKSDDGRASFLLCEFSDICCWTDDAELFNHLHDRWLELYPNAYEADRRLGRYRRLSEKEWQPFSSERRDENGEGENRRG